MLQILPSLFHQYTHTHTHTHIHIYIYIYTHIWGFTGGSYGKESTCNAGDLVQSLGWEDPLEEGMAIHSSVLAWRRGTWWATVHGIAKSQTPLSS